jgi:hypothetical protein
VNSKLKFLVAIASSLLMAGPVTAQGAAPAAAKQKPQPGDPGEIVCQKQEVVGSRLATRRVCMTRLQWQEQRAGDREGLEKAQVPSAKNSPG